MHWDTFKQDKYSTVGVDGICRVGEVWATSLMPDHKFFELHYTNCQRSTYSILSEISENVAL